MMGERVISLHQLFWLPLGHAGSRDAASHICTTAVFGPLCAAKQMYKYRSHRGEIGEILLGILVDLRD